MVASTFFFYDLETSGLNAREDRIMQFAGQRTTMDLQPIGEPVNLLVKLNDDTLPSPDAIVVTGITPQSTQSDGLSEAALCRLLNDEVFTPGTIAVGYNSIRFDDEFIRHLFWRNFYDPYEWSWKDGRSRWDILDVIRLTRALRPEGIEWPVTDKGQATNRLELITKANQIEHEGAHDALSDVVALVEVAKLIKIKQPQLFDYALKLRTKKEVQALVSLDDKQPFVYVSGRYDQAYNKATIAFPLTSAPNRNVVVYDLRHDPTNYFDLTASELHDRLYASWEKKKSEGFDAIPTKVLQYNRCPAVAPLGVLENNNGWKKIGLDSSTVKKHLALLLSRPDFAEKMRTLFEKEPYQSGQVKDAEASLYDGFIESSKDKLRIEMIRNADMNALTDAHPEFSDERLSDLLLHYKARSYPSSLSEDEQKMWESWRANRIKLQLPRYMSALQQLAKNSSVDTFLLEEMQLWAESIVPVED